MTQNNFCFGYVRISTDREKTQTNSIAVQSKQIQERYARQQETDKPFPPWKGHFVDELLGKKCKSLFHQREAAKELMSVVKPGDVVIVAAWDRLGRYAWDILETVMFFRSRSVRLIVLNFPTLPSMDGSGGGEITMGEVDFSNPMSITLIGMLSMCAQLERFLISKRTRDTLHNIQQSGRRLGRRPPPGWVWHGAKANRKMIPSKTEQEAMSHIFTMSKEGWGRGKILESLVASGFKRHDGSNWSDRAVRSVLENGEDFVPEVVQED